MATKIHRDENTLERLEDACKGLEELQEHLDYEEDDLQVDIWDSLRELERTDRYRGLYNRYLKAKKHLHQSIGMLSQLQGILEDKADKLMAEG